MSPTSSSLLSKLLLALVTGTLFGCASSPTMITSLEDLTSETQRQGLSEVNQNRILSITGLLPHAQVGSLYHYRKSRSPSTAIGISRGPSFYVESRIEGPDDPRVLEYVRANILEVRLKAGNALSKKVAQSKAQAQFLEAQAGGADEAKLGPLREELEQAVEKYETARNEFDTTLNETAALIQHAGVLIVRWDAKKGKKGGLSLAALFGFQKEERSKASGFAILSGLRLTTLFVGQDIWELDPNLEPTWWFWGGRFPWIFDTRFPFIGHWTLRSVRLTTHIFQTQKVIYLQDMELSEQFELALKGSYQQFSNLAKTLEELDRIEIEYIQSRVASLSNMGLVAETKRRVYPANFDVDNRAQAPESCDDADPYLEIACEQITGRCFYRQSQDLIDEELSPLVPSMDGWQTVYAVDTNFEALRERFEKP